MREQRVQVMAGNTFAVSDAEGDMEHDPRTPVGLFSFDTRFLSRWVLTIDGKRFHSLSRDDMSSFETRFLLVPGTASHYVDADVSVLRHRSLDEGFNERLTVLNHSPEPAEFVVRLEIGTDFADTAEIAAPGRRSVTVTPRPEDHELCLRYERKRFSRECVVRSTAPADVDQTGMTFRIVVEPNGAWSTDLHVDMVLRAGTGRDIRADLESYRRKAREDRWAELRRFLDQAPTLVAERPGLELAYRRSLLDLAALRYNPLSYSAPVPVAGMPWGMALYGRDAIVTALQTLPFVPDLAPAVLRMLALAQGGRLDDFHEEEPGKILATLRYGERGAFGDDPTIIYYGAADTTPLFVVLLDEYEQWSGDADLVRELRHPARMALDWIDEYGDPLGDGYLRYQRRNPDGVVNQVWKDSDDAIVGRDGREPGFPRATCELQGYVYDAKRRGARLAREFWGDPAYAQRLEREAEHLRERFNRDFWLPHRTAYALALDPDGGPVDALASNLGHLLWSGIVPADRAGQVAGHLLGPELFTGYGIRTLGSRQRRYNPVGSHLGAVWPFDNALAAAGLRRYGFDAEAARVAAGVLDMAAHFEGRLPELIAGYDRQATRYPVPLPAGGAPQSWSAGAALMMLSTLLGLRPCAGNLLVDPALPPGYGRIELLDIPGRWGHADAYGRDRTPVSGGVSS
ncbi:amylo-alpha-1,6-glucosidase [Micromonospora sp. WMMD882]|uniref:amylo-alpha-1,6-glucosidase n=1 Tax=Micromonospora sp. WMMD882 TaxID=3015151 RepID=UPI00248B5D43|nr:glycogen debranching N-terminal domain-containing protein [Micromonospora sp. WMMD882]WBB81652.1 amylo-alpha-1,6-glucosidase [Micromonospora sp. WMMD882]